ncbi:hypothetical protein [Methylibium petroleiphilum]
MKHRPTFLDYVLGAVGVVAALLLFSLACGALIAACARVQA